MIFKDTGANVHVFPKSLLDSAGLRDSDLTKTSLKLHGYSGVISQ